MTYGGKKTKSAWYFNAGALEAFMYTLFGLNEFLGRDRPHDQDLFFFIELRGVGWLVPLNASEERAANNAALAAC